jgi:Mlc titration factor MtfA (ptsG expression regulator)
MVHRMSPAPRTQEEKAMRSFIESLESRTLMSAVPLLTTLQKQDLQKLSSELSAIHAGSTVTTAEVQAVVADFRSIAGVATKPSSASVQKLKTDTKTALAEKPITPAEKVELVDDLQALLASAGVPTGLSQQAATDIKAIIVSSGVTKADVSTVMTDIRNFLSTF